LQDSALPGNRDWEKPDIVQVADREGIALKQRGHTLWACCPFHEDKNPSFQINPKKQTFRCYGCGKYGDVFSLVMELHGISFKDACVHLGVRPGMLHKPNPQIARKQELLKAFNLWCRSYYFELADKSIYRHQLHFAVKKNPNLKESLAWEYARYMSELHLIEWRLDILQSGSDADRLKLFKEVNHVI